MSSNIATETQEENSEETIISCPNIDETQQPYVSIEPVTLNVCNVSQKIGGNQTVTTLSITALPAGVQQRRNSVERVETSQSKNIELQNSETLFTKDEKPKQLEEMELVQPAMERIVPLMNSADQEGALTDISLEKNSENIPLFKEQCDTDNETDTSMKIEIDIHLATFKNQLKNTDKLDEKNSFKPQTIIINQEILKEEKESNVKEESEQSTSALSNTFLEENEIEDSILTIPNCSEQLSGFAGSGEQISKSLNESDIESEACLEKKDVQDHCNINVDSVESDVSVEQVIKLQTPLDIDVQNETKVVEKEHLSEESSASNTS